MTVDAKQSMRWLYDQGRAARWAMARTAAVGWLSGLAVIGQAFYLSRIVHGAFIEARPREALAGDFAAVAVAVVLRAALAWLRETSAFAAGETVRTRVRLRLFDRLLARGPAFVRGERAGGLSSVLAEQVEGLQDFYALYLPQLALAAALPLSIAAAVFSISWAAGALMLATAPLIPLFTVLVGMGAENISQRHFQALSRMSAHFLDALQGLATLKIFGRGRQEAERIGSVSADFRRRTMSVLRVAFISSAILEFFASLSIALIAVYLGMSYLGYFEFGAYGGKLSLAQGLFILFLAPEFYLPLRELGAHYHARAQALAAAEGIRGLLEGPVPGIAGGSLRPGLLEGVHIRCRGLRIAYADGRRPALGGIDLDLAPGCRTALVGGSGAGKSTLVLLLLGFLQPDAGEIRVNGTPLKDVDPEWWRRQIAWIGQDPAMFHGTLRENLLLGRPEATDSQVLAAARAAGVLEFAERLPQGLESPVGEDGIGLSRGEAQRVALARAFLKDAPVLLLDEPFAALDAGTEALAITAVESFGAGRTVLTVTHRLADALKAERVVVLDEGRIAEAGSPEELSRSGGRFQRLAGLLLKGEGP